MNKYYWIGGGVVVIGGIFFVIAKNRSANAAAAAQEAEPSPMLDTAYMGGLAPTSGGMSSPISYTGNGAGSVSSTPTVPGNSGSTNTGGGFDISNLFSSLFTAQAANNAASIRSQAQNYESTVLSSIIGQNGSATVSHSSEGTTIVNQSAKVDSFDSMINEIYKSELGRAPDEGGRTFYRNELMNLGRSYQFVKDQIHESPEAKKLRSQSAT